MLRPIIISTFMMIAMHALAKDIGDHIAQEFERAYTLLHSDPDQAFAIAEETEKLAQAHKLPYEQANSLYIQAWVYNEKRMQSGKAFLKYLQACNVLKGSYQGSEKDTELYTIMLFNVGRILFHHLAYKEALRYFDETILISKTIDNASLLARLHWLKSQVFNESEKKDLALSEINQAIDYAKVSGDEAMILNTLNSKGLTLIDKGEYVASRGLFSKMLDHAYLNTDKNHFKGLAWHNVAESYLQEGNLAEAAISFETALRYKNHDPSVIQRFRNLRDLCLTYLLLKNFNKAEEYGLLAIDLYDSVRLAPENYNLFDHMAQVAYAQNDYVLSRQYSERFIKENDKFNLTQTRDKYDMEMLAASFFAPLDTSYRADRYALLLWIVSASFTLLIAAGLTKQHLTKRAAARALREIQNDSWL